MFNHKESNGKGERGFSTILGMGITILVILMATSVFVTSIRSYREDVQSAERKQEERILKSIQTDIEIQEAIYYNDENSFEVQSKNKGSTVLETRKTKVLLDGEVVREGKISERLVDGTETDVWIPQENLKINIEEVEEEPERVKLVVEYGVDDYFNEIEEGGN